MILLTADSLFRSSRRLLQLMGAVAVVVDVAVAVFIVVVAVVVVVVIVVVVVVDKHQRFLHFQK